MHRRSGNMSQKAVSQEHMAQDAIVARAKAEDENWAEAEIRERRARFALSFTRYVAAAGGIATVIAAIMGLLSPQFPQLFGVALFATVVGVGNGLYPVFHRRGQMTIGANLAAGSLALAAAANFVLLPEVGLAVAVACIIVILMSNMFLGAKSGLWWAGASSLLLIVAAVLAELVSPTWFPQVDETLGLIVGLSILLVASLVVALIVRQNTAEQEAYFRQSKLASREIERRVAVEQEQRERLQQANKEIKARATAEQEQRERLETAVRQYVEFMTEVAGGDLSIRLSLAGDGGEADEPLNVLGQGLNEMTARLQNMVTQIQEEREYLETTVQRYVDYATTVGQGDLTARLALDGQGRSEDDPLTLLGRQLNETTASLQGMILQIRDAESDLSAAATEILAATTQQVSGANEQSAAISQTTTTVDEVKAIADQSVARAQEVADASQRTVEVSDAGRQAVQETIESMAQIKARVEGIAENILALSEQMQQIGQIIATVNDIASQSNMLALNASVEAARAGEQGKGFAVVAAEVRSLAEQSKQATEQVKAILEDIQRATNTTVMATEEGTKRVEEGVRLAARTGEVIRELTGVIGESSQAAMQMVAGGRQQASGIEQIAQAMGNINQATVQSLASTRQAEKTAQDLNELAHRLTQTVEQYQL
jgi:methyl-accepting chemotaxis protein